MKTSTNRTILLIGVALLVILAASACSGQAGNISSATGSGVVQQLTRTVESTPVLNGTRAAVGVEGSVEPRPSMPAPNQAEPTLNEQPATQPPPPTEAPPTEPPPTQAPPPQTDSTVGGTPLPAGTPIQLVIIQPAGTQTGIPVTGTTNPTGGAPLFLLIAGAAVIALAFTFFNRRQQVETSHPVVADSNHTAVTLPPSQPTPYAAPAAEAVFTDFATHTDKPAPMRYEYKRGMPTISPVEAPPIYDRSYLITVEIDRYSTQCDGVLVAMGSAQYGFSMYVQDSRLIFEQTVDGNSQRVISIIPLPFGSSTLQFRFIRTGPHQGIGSLYINSRMVNSVVFERTLPSPPSEGMDIGLSGVGSLTGTYDPPFPFQGTLNRVVFEIDGG